MQTKIIEATNGDQNWGKFLIGVFDDLDKAHRSAISNTPLLRAIGHGEGDGVLVLDLQTNEGAIFRIGGLASADLMKHRVWVCPLFEPFLNWLYKTWTTLDALPGWVNLTDAPFALYGYRRPGPSGDDTVPPTTPPSRTGTTTRTRPGVRSKKSYLRKPSPRRSQKR